MQTFSQALQDAKWSIAHFANGDDSDTAKDAKTLWYALDKVQQRHDRTAIDQISLDLPMNDEETAALDREVERETETYWESRVS